MKFIQSKQLVRLVALVGILGYSTTSLAAAGAFETSIAIDGPAVVDVSNQSGTVVVRGDDVEKITIRAYIAIDKRLSNTDPSKAARIISAIKRSPPVVSDGNHVVISALVKNTHQRYASISYEIVVPQNAAVNVRSVSGDVRVVGVTGQVKASSETGKVSKPG